MSEQGSLLVFPVYSDLPHYTVSPRVITGLGYCVPLSSNWESLPW